MAEEKGVAPPLGDVNTKVLRLQKTAAPQNHTPQVTVASSGIVPVSGTPAQEVLKLFGILFSISICIFLLAHPSFLQVPIPMEVRAPGTGVSEAEVPYTWFVSAS